MTAPALELERLSLEAVIAGKKRTLVRSVTLSVASGEVLALVGESGSGKSLTCLACADLLDPAIRLVEGERRIAGYAIDAGSSRRDVALRVGVVFQNPLGSLNPIRRIGLTLADAARLTGGSDRALRQRVLESLADVGISDPERCADGYPHQLSGGQQQRVMIALATIREPALIIADEPTTALDSTTQQRVLLLLRQKLGLSGALLVTHDLSIAAQVADRIAVMYHGAIVEQGPASAVISSPQHPYTAALITALPHLVGPRRAPQPLRGQPLEAGVPCQGCAFAERCSSASDRCRESPSLDPMAGHDAACWHPRGIND